MRRTLQPLLAATAGLSLLLAACSGESPTSPKPPVDNGGGTTCTVTVTLDATSVTPMAGTAIVLRATVKKGGVLVPDGTSVLFTTDFGTFLETGLPSVSKVTQNGFADVTLGSTSAGLAKVKAAFECGSAEKSIEFQFVEPNKPFISSIDPKTGSCGGGELVTINGGRFGTVASVLRVTFGGKPGSIQTVTDTKITVLTPARTLANAQVPEVVDVVIQFFANDIPTQSVTAAGAFTYYCVNPDKRMTLTSLAPNSGSQDGGLSVTITGNNFLPSATSGVATTRVTFGSAPASVVSVTNTSIVVLTPRHTLANPAVPETVDVAVTVDLGLVSQQSAVLSQAFTYRAGGGSGTCTGAQGLFLATVKPEDPTSPGSPDGGDIVVIAGGGFTAGGSSTTLDRTAVFFGGVQGVTLSVTDAQIRVSTPRHTLASPDRPDTVDVKVIVDAGGPREACVQANGAYTYYPGGYLEPIITSISPSSGPNDVSTRVTMFGRNFKLPMQVFVGGVEAAVVEITASQIIFLTPQATGPNSALAGTLADVKVRDPYAGKEYTSPISFQYYACPTVNGLVPSVGPWNQNTTVTISGQAFEEPVELTALVNGQLIRPSVTSVSSSLITFVMPAISSFGTGSAGCGDVKATLTLRFPTLACNQNLPTDQTFTYSVVPMTATSASPAQLNQDGSPFGSPIGSAPATVTVMGSNFADPMTAQLISGSGALVANTLVSNVVVANQGQVSFPAPAVPDGSFNEQPCVPAGGTTITGVKWVPTSFGIRLTNARTGCHVDLPNALLYNPIEPACRSGVTVTQVTAPAAATLCQAYSSGSFSVAGGIAPYTASLTGGPTGIAASPATMLVAGNVIFTGMPEMAANGVGQASTSYAGTLSVTDSSALTTDGSAPVTIVVTDPVAPFSTTASKTTLVAPAIIPDTATVTTSTGIGAVTLTAGTVTPALPLGVSFSFAGGTATLTSTLAAPVPGTSTVTITGADTGCGATHHEATVKLSLNY